MIALAFTCIALIAWSLRLMTRHGKRGGGE